MACLAFCLPTGSDCEGRGVARPVVGTRLGSAGGEGGGDDCAGDGGETACGCGCGCGGGGGGGGVLCTLVVGGGSGLGTVVGGGSGLGIVVVVWAAAREPLTKSCAKANPEKASAQTRASRKPALTLRPDPLGKTTPKPAERSQARVALPTRS